MGRREAPLRTHHHTAKKQLSYTPPHDGWTYKRELAPEEHAAIEADEALDREEDEAWLANKEAARRRFFGLDEQLPVEACEANSDEEDMRAETRSRGEEKEDQ